MGVAPKRIQRRRTKGWKAPAGAVYVGRPGPFGNPFPVNDNDRGAAVAMFRDWIGRETVPEWAWRAERDVLLRLLPGLRGLDLMCWCPLTDAAGAPVPCHADVLLEIANQDVTP